MFKLTTTVDDSSPLITYGPAGYWNQSVPGDPELTKFWGKSYTYTWNPGASASVIFNGTGIKIYGISRSTGGCYTVSLDNTPHVLNATAPGTGPMENGAVLFNITGLQQGRHTVTVTNADASLYIDCITWWGTVGSGESEKGPTNETNDDTDSKFFWHPADAWKNPPRNASQFKSGTGHSTFQAGASVNYTFSGAYQCAYSDAVSVFGTSGPYNGNYAVLLDDIPSRSFSANRSTYAIGVMLFHADNLGNGTHILSLVNSDEGGLLEIDYALSYTDSWRAPPETSPKAGDAAAITVGSVVFIILVVIIWLLLRRNKTLWMRLENGYSVQSQYDLQYPSTHNINPGSSAGNDNAFGGNTLDIEARNATLQRIHYHRPLMSETQLTPNRSDKILPLLPGQQSLQPTRPADVQQRAPVRSSTILTTSTLVAENGSNVSNIQAMKFMIHLRALRGSSAIQDRVSDSQTRLLSNSDEPSSTSLPPADDRIEVDGNALVDENDSLLDTSDQGGRPLSTTSQSSGYWQVPRSTGRS